MAANSEPPNSVRHGYVLVVDDEEPNRQLLSALLSAQGFQVQTARDGPSALSAIAAGGIDLVLLDVMMPGMDGIEVCRRVRQELGLTELIVVFVTALSDRESRMRAKTAGANDFLVKPVDSYELGFRARQWLRLGRLRELSEGVQRLGSGLGALAQTADDVALRIDNALRSTGDASVDGNPEQAELAALKRALASAAEQLSQISADSRRLVDQERAQAAPLPAPTSASAPPRNHQS